MWAEPTGWTAPYFELRTACHACGEASMTMIAGFNPSSTHICHNCGAAFTHEEGILRMAEKYTRECIEEAERGVKTEPELLALVDREIFGRAKFGSNATLQYAGYLEEGEFLTIPLPRSFRHPPRAFASVHPEGLDDIEAGTFGMDLPATLTEVQVPARGTTSSGGQVPIHLQAHGNIEDFGEDLPPHFTFFDDAFRSVVRRDYDLAVFLSATATEAFVSALLTDLLSEASNEEAIYELVSRAGAEHKARDVLPLALGERLPKSLSKRYGKVGKARNEFAHGKRPGTTLVEALHALETCLSCMLWALRKSAPA